MDGDLSTYIDACVPGYRFAAQGLAGCALDTQQLGNHSVTFFLSDNRAVPSFNTAARIILVHPACSEDETLCADLTCSISGLCLDGAAVEQNAAPQLQFSDGEQSTLYIPRGANYQSCISSDNTSDTTGRVCESGPVAYDEEDGPIPDRILACPPDECLKRGCPGHEFYSKGLQGCGIDTENAHLGTSFNVSFVVFDSHRPAASASIFRTITVISPCSGTEIYCPDRAVQCASVPCALRDHIDDPQVLDPPEITLQLEPISGDSHELSMSPGGLRRLTMWAVCGKAPPVDFTSVCGAGNHDDVAHLSRNAWRHCGPENNEICALAVRSSTQDPLVALFRRDLSACGIDGSTCELLCSIGSIASGHCPPSSQYFTMHTFHEGGFGKTMLRNAQTLQIQTSIVPALATASLPANVTVHVAESSDEGVFAVESLAGEAVGDSHCSGVARHLHRSLERHVNASAACIRLLSQAQSVSGTYDSGRLVLFTEVMNSDVFAPGGNRSAYGNTNMTMMGALKLEVSVTIGADIGSSTSSEDSALQSAAAACLGSLSYTEFTSEMTEDVPWQSAEAQVHGMLEVSIDQVETSAGQCLNQSVSDSAIDAAVAVVEDSYMQQLMIDRLVCCPCLAFS